MRFKVDENLHWEIAELLRSHGHDALTVFDQGLRGRSDTEIGDMCQSEERILLFPPKHYPGLIVLRLRRKSRPAVRRVIEGIIPRLNKEALEGRLWIVDEQRIRIHYVRSGSGAPPSVPQ